MLQEEMTDKAAPSGTTTAPWYKSKLLNEMDSEEKDFVIDNNDPNDTSFDQILNLKDGIMIEGRDTLCPNFILFEKEKQRIQRPFRRTLIVKLMGRKIRFGFLNRRPHQLWAKRGKLKLVDINDEYYLVTFDDKIDYEVALTGGPWAVADTYLYITTWKPNLRPKLEEVSTMTIWAHIPKLPMEYFDKKMLLNIGKAIGKTIKVDMTTMVRDKGKYARICVEVDLDKPLLP